MKRILFLDNSANPQYDAQEHVLPHLTLPYDVVKSDVDPIPKSLDSYSHLIIGGSMADSYDGEWQSKVYDLIRVAMTGDKPILGICFGHQVIIRALYGNHTVVQKPACDIGWEEIEVLRDDYLLGARGSRIRVFAFHGYEVGEVPSDRVDVIARSGRCKIMAYKFRDKPVWGVQYHFETNTAQARELLEKFDDCGGMAMCRIDPDYALPNGAHSGFFERFQAL